MSDWNSLSMQERAEVMKLAIENGIYDLDTIRAGYNEFAKGGKIHIKPENRGKFTALKKRTGHSATWFKQHGTPAQKKMATFAINAAKWKHGDGGNLYGPGGAVTYGKPFYSYDNNGQLILDENGKPTINYNATLPEVVIIPDSQKSPADRNADERFRAKSLKDYAEHKQSEWTAGQLARSNNRYQNSTAGKVLNVGKDIASVGKNIVEFIPTAGDVIQGLDAVKDAASGNYLQAGIGLGMLAVPNIVEKPLKYLGKRIKSVFELTDNQWDEMYNAAIKANDMEEAQRLRDLHFMAKAPDTAIANEGLPIHAYHGTGKQFNEFDTTGKYSTLDEGYYGVGAYFAPNKEIADMYADTEKTPIVYDTYLNISNPLVHVRDENADLLGKAITDNDGVVSILPDDLVDPEFDMTEYVATKPSQIKLADAITYDDAGNVIPLSKRDNFAVGDMRYLKGTDIDGNIFELPARTMRGGIKDADGNIVSDEMLINNWKRSQDFYKMRLRSRGLKQPGKTLKTDYDTMFAELQKRFPDATAEEVEAYIKNSGGGFAIPEVGFGAVDKKLNTTGKQMKGTTNNAKIHEDSHLVGTPTEEITWSNILDINLGEAAARGTQIKSMLGIADNTPITADQLKYMKDNYVRLTRADNNMQAFLNSITDFDLAADWLSRNSYSMGGAFNLLNYDFLKYPFGGFGL